MATYRNHTHRVVGAQKDDCGPDSTKYDLLLIGSDTAGPQATLNCYVMFLTYPA